MIGAPVDLALGGGEVHVWWIALDEIEPDALAALTAEEAARGMRFHWEDDRRRWLAARAALRHILAGYSGIAAKELAFRYGRWGKPELRPLCGVRKGSVDAHTEGSLRFNLAHAGARAVVAVARGQEVGVDLEWIDVTLDPAPLLAVACTPAETARLPALPEIEQVAAFLELWTLKEAYLKAIGTGLSREPRTIDIVEEDDGRIVVRDPELRHNLTTWYACRLEREPGWIAALVTAGAAPVITGFSWPSFARHGTPGTDRNGTAATL